MKKFLCFLSVFVLLFSCLALGVSAEEYSPEHVAHFKEQMEDGANGNYAYGYENFYFIKGWDTHYLYDVAYKDPINGDKIFRFVIYTDSTIPLTSYPKFQWQSDDSSTNVAFLYIQNNTGSGMIKYYEYDYANDMWRCLESHLGGTTTHRMINGENIHFVSADTDVIDYYRGDVFFLATPQVTGGPLEVAIKTALNQWIQKVGKLITVCLLCGVGCLACLISLPILKKVFYRFQIKS